MAQQDDESMQLDTVVEDLNLTSQATTIDAAVIQSRILQSASIQKEDASEQPHFAELSAVQAASGKVEYRRVRCPAHRYTPLREHWEQILTPLVEYLKLQVSTAIAEQQQSTCGPRRRRRFDTRVCVMAKDERHPNVPRKPCCSWTQPIFARKPRFSMKMWGGYYPVV